jgi:hypothetical protein
MKKRILIAATAALIVFGVVFAMAASLGGITGDDLGADDDVVASCDTDGVTTSYTTAYSDSGTAGYKVGDVTVGSIADACNGASMRVTLSGSGGTSLGERTVTVAVNSGGGDSDDTLDFSSLDVLAESVTGIHVVIAD